MTERNLNIQPYFSDQIDLPKTQALQYNLYKAYSKEVTIITEKLTNNNFDELLLPFTEGLIIDTFDNYEARLLVHDAVRRRHINCLHIGFSQDMTFSIEWEPNYTVPTNFKTDFDICTLPGASSFVRMVASLGSLVVQEFITSGSKLEYIGNKYSIREVK